MMGKLFSLRELKVASRRKFLNYLDKKKLFGKIRFLTTYEVECSKIFLSFKFLSMVLPNGYFDGTTLCCKILCEIKKIESENHHSGEREFPNSSCFQC